MPNNKQLDNLIEEATVDCYDEYECLAGFSSYLGDKLLFPFSAQIVGEEVKVVGLDFDEEQIKAVCEKQGKKYKINILNIEYTQKNVKNYQYIEAFRKWFGRK
ncbi:hypothetical protein COU88_00480 [Candidatus Roizmanbacteria bacterium CG10_big_fil_rev_8_21_14_0_10_39_6]|uniref:Uncharacterized protein n=1 Tax=Candidatus Roizmanbacteria bacterium CG10_big_fil_rev_8_21_14_0_10_39_6 TaxID=1974853 RepID=A0A2M8KTJ4_9BACT|nr:MAG: hypothetical protein COU88_00480 [Candidatus Roizmanbacteria bacterium CG10_big_fil_rev_8_21_14_0_10_39_6]